MGVLARAPADRLTALMAALGGKPATDWLRRPEIGAVMTRGRAGGTGDAFTLGEMTVTRCALRLKDHVGIVGHAYVQGRDVAKAEAAALADAMLQCEAYAGSVRAAVVEPLRAEEAARRLRARRKAGATKVDFFTMVRAEG
jgi:alpha-D-ribose 1-methylphosphonate 5-triphosphate synthase subunit PhnG